MMKALYEDLGAALKFASEQAFQLAKFTPEEKELYEEYEFNNLEYRMNQISELMYKIRTNKAKQYEKSKC